MVIDVLEQPISGLLTKSRGILVDYDVDEIWNSAGISLAKRLKKDPGLKKKVDEVLTPSNLEKYVVKVNPLAPTRCIDGRKTVGWEKNSDEQKAFLGPKIAGGTVHAALTHRIVDSHNLTDDLLIEHDIEYVVNQYRRIGVGFGGHIDTHQHGWNTGCGAVDNIDRILELIRLPENQQQLRGISKFIMGEAYDGAHIANEVIGRMLYLSSLIPSYLPREKGRKGEFLYKKTVVNLIRKHSEGKHEPVPRLEGNHNEVAIVLNSAAGTTVDTDRLSFDNGGKIQVFGWDLWEVYKEAARLYPYNVHSAPASQQDAVSKRVKHVTTRTLLGIATAMTLTDGSIKVVTIESRQV